MVCEIQSVYQTDSGGLVKGSRNPKKKISLERTQNMFYNNKENILWLDTIIELN